MNIANFVKRLMRNDGEPQKTGSALYRDFQCGAERYFIDCADDFNSDGWQQYDTDQDASYFGVWVHAGKRLILTLAEGDWTLVVSPTLEAYRAEIEEMNASYGEGRIARTIDGHGNVVDYVQDREAFLPAGETS